MPTRPSQKCLVGLALLLLPEGLGVESVGRASDPGKNRQGDQNRYDRLHGPHSICDPGNTIADRDRLKRISGGSQLRLCCKSQSEFSVVQLGIRVNVNVVARGDLMGAKQAADAAIAFVARWSAPGIGAALNHRVQPGFHPQQGAANDGYSPPKVRWPHVGAACRPRNPGWRRPLPTGTLRSVASRPELTARQEGRHSRLKAPRVGESWGCFSRCVSCTLTTAHEGCIRANPYGLQKRKEPPRCGGSSTDRDEGTRRGMSR